MRPCSGWTDCLWAIWRRSERNLEMFGLQRDRREAGEFWRDPSAAEIPCFAFPNSLYWRPKFPVLNGISSTAPPNNHEKSGALPKPAAIRASDSSAFVNNREFECLAGRRSGRLGPLLCKAEIRPAIPAKLAA